MSDSPGETNGKKKGPGGDKLGIGEIYWYRNDVGAEDRAVEVLTERGELFFYRLRRHYLYRAGNLPYDPANICTKMGYKTVRPFKAGFDELVTAGLVSVEDGMIRFPHADEIIADVQANRDRKANDGRAGGEAKAANARNVPETSPKFAGSLDEVSAKLESENEQNQSLSSSTVTNYHESLNKTTSVGSIASISPGLDGGGGGSDVHQVIEEFYRIAGNIWGQDVVAKERIVTIKNDARAGEWIDAAGGSVGLVLQLLGPALTSYSQGRRCPGTLGAISLSMPKLINEALTAAPSRTASKSFAGPASTVGDDTWVHIKSLAFRNGHLDVADEIRRRAVEISDDEANRFAEDMRSYVSTKKAMAAA